MKNINIVSVVDIDKAPHSQYGWSNESKGAYDKCFEEIKGDFNEKIEVLSSVGCGDHILFALSKFEVENINYVEISEFSSLMAFFKFSILKYYNFDMWSRFVYGQFSEFDVERLIKHEELKQIIKCLKIEEDDIFTKLSSAWLGSIVNISVSNKEFLSSKNSFLLLKERLNKVKDIDIYVQNLWNVKQDKVKKFPNVLLTSNAYSNAPLINQNEYVKNYIITTIQFGANQKFKKVCTEANWSYYLIKSE